MRKSFKATFVAAGAAVAMAVSANAASATQSTPAIQHGSGGFCSAVVDIVDPGQNYAQGTFSNYSYHAVCYFWLERAYYDSSGHLGPYQFIGSYGTNPDSINAPDGKEDFIITNSYWDGSGVRVKACVQSYQGVTCTSGV
ncbi:hypothetical protein ABH935_008732 [Catenulispora sp. GAS73]|uniref:hypothetical protein n=1 Tax=Catenulispora sp. GAS73 TaxID=3156269 RepID=UPI003517E84B